MKLKNILLKIIFVHIFILSFTPYLYAPDARNITYNNISKVFVLFENGQSQVFVLDTPINYTYHVNDDQQSDTTGTLQRVFRGALNQNSNISKIAFYMESITLGDDIMSINGYFTLDSDIEPEGSVESWTTGSSEINSWFSGTKINIVDERSVTSGVVNFNAVITGDEFPNGYNVTHGSAFNPQDKRITLSFEIGAAVLAGSSVQSENL